MISTWSRRELLCGALAAGGAAVAGRAFAARAERRYTLDLRCSAIGVRVDQLEAIELAAKHGFESVTPRPEYLAGLAIGQAAELQQLLKSRGLRWGAAGLPVEFRSDEDTFRRGVSELPSVSAALQRAGVTRVGTWLRPSHAQLTYWSNFRQHARRLRECARIMGDHGLRFGLEYVGPKTSWTSSRHAFVHTMAETKELIAEIGQANVGFVLDSWHWYTAHETVDDLRSLSNDEIVACDLNDAPVGVEVDEQIDSRRELPAATGVIDLKAFLSALAMVGYDGPVRAEPFNARLNALDNEAAVQATAHAMKQAFDSVEG